ncbi:MAG: hypothetical protein QM762_17975 [Chryseolinea sp.]
MVLKGIENIEINFDSPVDLFFEIRNNDTSHLIIVRNYFFSVIAWFACANTLFGQAESQFQNGSATTKTGDSLSAHHSKDSTKNIIASLDSIEQEFSGRRDSLRSAYESQRGLLTKNIQALLHKPESLKDSLIEKTRLDSIKSCLTKLDSKYRTALSKMTQSTAGKISALPQTPLVSERLEKFEESIANLQLPDTPSLSERFPDLSLNASDLKAPTINSGLPDNLGYDLKESVDQAANISDMAANGKDIDNLVDQNVKKIDGVKGITETAKVPNLPNADSKQMLQDMAAKEIKSAAINHFADKKEVLNKTLESVSKYKNKYSSVASLKEIPTRTKNLMRGKHALERIIPGLQFQVLTKGNAFLVDFNPYFAYRWTHKWTITVGWNQRIAYDRGTRAFESSLTIFGPRLGLEYKLKKGFSPKIETEAMNSPIPSYLQRPEGPMRVWVPTVFIGMKKEYKIYGNLKGTATIMIRSFNYNNISPYPDVVNARMGLEYRIKQSRKKTAKEKQS